MKYVIGHKNPDTDSIVSAYCLAEFLGDGYKACASGNLNKETCFIFEKVKMTPPQALDLNKAENYVLVDHNFDEEMMDGIDKDKIEAIYDHHRLGGLSLRSPIHTRIEPVGCTATIIAKLYREAKKKIPKRIAEILLAAILSDTLEFRSPTTSEVDKEIAKELELIAGISCSELASKLFKAKSDIAGMSIEEVLTADFKEFQHYGTKIGFGVFETVDPKPALKKKEEILEGLADLRKKENVDLIFFAIVDILNENAYLILLSDKEKEVAIKAYGFKVGEDGIMELPGMVSRKKQFNPPILKTLENV
ncbi:manganese-dependent inorganic pyrophosphatase [bacterium CG2_30_37_16]|nr:MAG: manganese-dependent inorganic pyrophosphatase [bacterium CG2_30_37_16]PJB07003.1 MAG: manganese-dependent inorganic pyrophosphatase [bacterium (Candidatus Howlettbacteria) CG_4_9_14_3_um_filter_37_10]